MLDSDERLFGVSTITRTVGCLTAVLWSDIIDTVDSTGDVKPTTNL